MIWTDPSGHFRMGDAGAMKSDGLHGDVTLDPSIYIFGVDAGSAFGRAYSAADWNNWMGSFSAATQPSGIAVAAKAVITGPVQACPDQSKCSGIKVSITYQLVDSTGSPLATAGLVFQEKLCCNDIVITTPGGQVPAMQAMPKGFNDIGPNSSNGNQRATNNAGQFTDAPVGVMVPGNLAFRHSVEQKLQAVGPEGTYSFGTNKITVSSTGAGDGKIKIENKKMNFKFTLERP